MKYDRAFYFYHPYLTYIDDTSNSFISPEGKALGELTADTEALFEVGKKAFNLLVVDDLSDLEKEQFVRKGFQLVQASREAFDKSYQGYLASIDGWRVSIADRHKNGTLVFKGDRSKAHIEVDINELEDHQIMSIIWQFYSTHLVDQNPSDSLHIGIREMYLFNALREIDNALLALAMGEGAAATAIDAANSLSNAMAIDSGSEHLTKARRELAYQGAIERIKRDPRQKEKIFVFECWKEWQGTPERYDSKASFARDMLSKSEHLKSQKKIEDWCRDWEKENPAS